MISLRFKVWVSLVFGLFTLVAQAEPTKTYIVTLDFAKPASLAKGNNPFKAVQRSYANSSAERSEISDLHKKFAAEFDKHVMLQVPTGRRSGLHKNIQTLTSIPSLLITANDEELGIARKIPGVRHVTENLGGGKPTLFRAGTISHFAPSVNLGQAGQGQTIVILDSGFQGPLGLLNGRITNQACFSGGGWSNGIHYHSLCPGGAAQFVGAGANVVACPGSSDSRCWAHGTWVANVAAAANFGTAEGTVSGVARNASVITVSVISGQDNGPGYEFFMWDFLASLNWVLAQRQAGVNIASVNMSFAWSGGHSWFCDDSAPSFKAAFDALLSVGVVPVVASGNDFYNGAVNFPACLSNVISVGASNRADNTWDTYSNVASFMSMFASGSMRDVPSSNGTFIGAENAWAAGTSFAAPQVAGAIAVLRSNHPQASLEQILYALRNGTQQWIALPTGEGPVYIPRLDVQRSNDVFPLQPYTGGGW